MTGDIQNGHDQNGHRLKQPQSDTKTATFCQQVKSHLVIKFLQLQHKSSPAECQLLGALVMSTDMLRRLTNRRFIIIINFNIHIDLFWRYSGSKSKVIKNCADFWTLFFPPKSNGRAFQKLYPHYQPCLMARHLEKFREDTPTSPEVIGGAYAEF